MRKKSMRALFALVSLAALYAKAKLASYGFSDGR